MTAVALLGVRTILAAIPQHVNSPPILNATRTTTIVVLRAVNSLGLEQYVDHRLVFAIRRRLAAVPMLHARRTKRLPMVSSYRILNVVRNANFGKALLVVIRPYPSRVPPVNAPLATRNARHSWAPILKVKKSIEMKNAVNLL